MKRILVLAAILALGACSSTNPPPQLVLTGNIQTDTQANLQKIGAFTLADLAAADADAVANNDTVAHACYPAVAQFVTSLNGATGNLTVAGAFSTFQKARDLAGQASAGVPTYLKVGCAALLIDTQTFFAKLAAIGGASALTAGAIPPVAIIPVAP